MARRKTSPRLPGSMPHEKAAVNAATVAPEAIVAVGDVCAFFREPVTFQALEAKVFPALFRGRASEDPIRLWVPGCGTGEEAYSLAIALTEYARHAGSTAPAIVYATDINSAAVETSRAGIYPAAIAASLGPQRLREFFVAADGNYRIAKSIRDLCIFARQNLLGDPPFSRMDLISCQNVLPNLGAAAHERVLPVLHYALKPTGYLILAPTETPGYRRGELFEEVAAGRGIFKRKPVLNRRASLMEALTGSGVLGGPPKRDAMPQLPRVLDHPLFSRYVPPGVLVDRDYEVRQYVGETSLYLVPQSGAVQNLFTMARVGLLAPMRSVLRRARKENTAVTLEPVTVKAETGLVEIALTAIPVPGDHGRTLCWLLFEPTDRSVSSAETQDTDTRVRRTHASVGILCFGR